jgi:4-hydroxy-2-oxoheptanedioate aldolase
LHGPRYPTETDLVVVAQIETPAGLEACEAIAAVPGLDVLFLGPDDMKLRLGLPIETPTFGNEQLAAAARRTAAACRAAGKFAAIPGVSKENAAQCRELGYQMLFGGSDVGFLRTGAPATLLGLKDAIR